MSKIGISNFVRRQTRESEFTHFYCGWDFLVSLTTKQFKDGNYSKGYRDGVVVVHIKSENCGLFWTYDGYPMSEGMLLKAEYRKVVGREHEPPKVIVTPCDPKVHCKYVDVILYRADVLEEDGDRSTDCDWEIISINGRVNIKASPMDPMTIVRNWKHLPGGTKMKGRTAEEVLEELCQSIMFKNGISTSAEKKLE
jgi:hypothetical protein